MCMCAGLPVCICLCQLSMLFLGFFFCLKLIFLLFSILVKVMISAKEEPDAPISPAMDGLLRVHKCIIDYTDGKAAQALPGTGNMVPTRLLVAASQAGSLIGKQGATIKSIQEATKSVVRILGMSALNFMFCVLPH